MTETNRNKRILKAKINSIVASTPITYNECKEDMGKLLKKMLLTIKMGQLLQEYLSQEYAYDYSDVKFEIILRQVGEINASYFADSTNKVCLDAEFVKLFDYDYLLQELLHELKHKRQADRDKKTICPYYAKYLANTEDEYEILWDMEAKELDAELFSYFKSKFFKRAIRTNAKEQEMIIEKSPVSALSKYLVSNLKFAIIKNRLTENKELSKDIESQDKIKSYFLVDTNNLLVETSAGFYSYSLKELETLAKTCNGMDNLISNYLSMEANKQVKEGAGFDYTNPQTMPIPISKLLYFLHKDKEKIDKFGVCRRIKEFYISYITTIFPDSTNSARLDETTIRKLVQLIESGEDIKTEEDIIYYKQRYEEKLYTKIDTMIELQRDNQK